MLRIAQELESPSTPPLPIPVALPVQHEEAARTGLCFGGVPGGG